MAINLTLEEICFLYNTDKNSTHSYVTELYESLLSPVRFAATRVLEIGVDFGGSACMWRDYFPNAIITVVDCFRSRQLTGQDRIVHLCGDAYSEMLMSELSGDYDVMVDDGPHTIDSLRFFADRYSQKMKSGGLMIIEDVQDIAWCSEIQACLPGDFVSDVVDLRHVKGRYDDIAIVARKRA